MIVLTGFVEAGSYKQKKTRAMLMQEYNQYRFLEEHLTLQKSDTDSLAPKVRKIVNAALACGASALVAHVILWLACQIPYVKQELSRFERGYNLSNKFTNAYRAANNLSGGVAHYIKGTANGVYEMQDFATFGNQPLDGSAESNTFFNACWACLFAVLSPIFGCIVSHIMDRQVWTYRQILVDYVSHWMDYKVCTPPEFRDQLDALHLAYVARHNKLDVDEAEAERIVTMLVTRSVEFRQLRKQF